MPGFSSWGIFLSYRRHDSTGYAHFLRSRLNERFPDARVFMDVDSIRAGRDFIDAIQEALDSCAVFVALIGPQWMTIVDEEGHRRLDIPDDFVRAEVRTALEREVPVIPVLVDRAKPPRQPELPVELHQLARLQAFDWSHDRFEYDAGRLLDQIQQELAEAARKAQEEAERRAQEEAERRAREEAERRAQEEAAIATDTATEQHARLRALPGHTKPVWCLAFNPEGSLLASCSKDKTVRLWNLNAWGESRKLTPPQRKVFRAIRAVTFDPSGKYVAGILDHSASIYIWDVRTGKRVKTLAGHTNLGYCVAYHPSRALLASCAGDGTVRIWDTERKFFSRPLILRGHAVKQRENYDGTISEEAASVYHVAFAPRQNVLASCADDMTIQLWSPVDGRNLGGLTGHRGAVNALAFHPKSDLLASASEDCTVRLWDFNTRDQGQIFSRHSYPVTGVAFNHDGRLLASCDDGGIVQVWNTDTGKQLESFGGHSAGSFLRRGAKDVVFHPKDDILVSCGQDRMIRFWGPF